MREAQQHDPDIAFLLEGKENGQKPAFTEISPLSKTAKEYYMEWDRIELQEDISHWRWESNDGSVIRWLRNIKMLF